MPRARATPCRAPAVCLARAPATPRPRVTTPRVETRRATGGASRDEPRDVRANGGRDGRGEVLPYARTPRIARIVGRGCLGDSTAGARVPPQRLIASAPLALESMRTRIGRAAAEVEHDRAVVGR